MRRYSSLLSLLVLLVLSWTPTALAVVQSYNAVLSGPNEFPANASPGTGFATVDYDDTAHLLTIGVSFSGLTGTTTASHIHAPTTAPFFQNAGVATTTPYFAGFPIGVTSGTYNNVLDLTMSSSWNPSYVTNQGGGTNAGAEAALAAAMAAGKAYFNIHTSTFGGGEIRGFLIPEPTTCVLMAFALAGLGCIASPRRR